jgi:hypothetical protein
MSSGTEQAALKHLRALQSELERVDEEASAKVCVASRLARADAGRRARRISCDQVVQIENEAAKKRRPVYERREARLSTDSPPPLMTFAACFVRGRCPWPLSATCSAWAGANLAIASILADGTTKIDLCKRLDHR